MHTIFELSSCTNKVVNKHIVLGIKAFNDSQRRGEKGERNTF